MNRKIGELVKIQTEIGEQLGVIMYQVGITGRYNNKSGNRDGRCRKKEKAVYSIYVKGEGEYRRTSDKIKSA